MGQLKSQRKPSGGLIWRGLGTILVLTIPSAYAGNPLNVQANGVPNRWSTAVAVPFHPDGGSLGNWDNATAVANTLAEFNRWGPDIAASSALTFTNAGGIPGDGDVDTIAEFNALDNNCADGISPYIFDANGSIFAAIVGAGSGVIGFAGPECFTATGEIDEGLAAINGACFNGIAAVTDGCELSEAEFRSTFAHEDGHWLNLDHSQVNGHFFFNDTDRGFEQFGSPPRASVELMFPISIDGATTPRMDDIAAISRLYPAAGFAPGRIEGTIFLSDGATPFQGANVIARNTADPFNDAISNVSGVPFAPPASVGSYELPGLTAGADYVVEITNVLPQFTVGSSVGPLDPPVRIPAAEEFYNGADEAATNPPDDTALFENVASVGGGVTGGINIIFNDLCDQLRAAMGSMPRLSSPA